uniref:TransThyretin-Related family domain n=1 Tax=Caenorhabditis tropicalis TaxID=1561998 RepID=A0A1I7U719_9PELO
MAQFLFYVTVFSLLSVPVRGLFNVIGNDQYVTVTGRLVCDGQPASDVLVKLYEDGTVWDTKLDSTRTSFDGTFRVSGHYTKIFDMDPKINIYHSCNHYGLCDKKLRIDIPHYAVSAGDYSYDVDRNYDIGTLNLADQFSGETTDCIH